MLQMIVIGIKRHSFKGHAHNGSLIGHFQVASAHNHFSYRWPFGYMGFLARFFPHFGNDIPLPNLLWISD